ncbi:MAG: type III PLP-dependent enzyme [Pseudomonadota bacterium]|nr:type III PLP-dependent enzyme [Pseudomonadota bacterium]
MTEKIRKFLEEYQPDTPCLVVDLDVIETKYNDLAHALPEADIYYAMKANPAPEVLNLLNSLGAYFDAASIYEIESCLGIGISADRIGFGNTVKKQRDIGRAHDYGVGLFAFDSRAELSKLAVGAPGAQVYCRIFVDGAGSDWPLSRKFGCKAEQAILMLKEAGEMGMLPAGLSFHVGSQQRNPAQWDKAIEQSAVIFEELSRIGMELTLLNIGGGFPANYRQSVEPVNVYGAEISNSLVRNFGHRLPRVIVEPGRYIVGDSGIIQTEVILVAEKSREAGRRWIFLDVGKFGGLPETFEEAIQYRITTPHDGSSTGPVVLAGPTCAEVDILYDVAGYSLPLDLAAGDRVEIHSAGAYTATYSAVGFNGFPPLSQHYI